MRENVTSETITVITVIVRPVVADSLKMLYISDI